MKIVILDATKGENRAAGAIKSVFEAEDKSLDFYKLENSDIKPCRSCNACGHATPGRCVIKDDMQAVLRSMARSDVIVMLTPVRFGGYSSQLKKAVDRLMPFGLPLYCVRDGHLLHPMRYEKKSYLVIGLMENYDAEQEKNFRELVAQNGLNFQYPCESVILKDNSDEDTVRNEVRRVYTEVIHHD